MISDQETHRILTTQSQEILHILQTSNIFGELNSATLKGITPYCAVQRYSKGDIIFDIGQPIDSLYVIAEGQVVIERVDGERIQQVAQFSIGESFGEVGLFTDTARDARATAFSDVQLLSFPSRDTTAQHLTEQSPAVFSHILRTLVVRLSSRIRSINRLISQNSRVTQELWHQLMIDNLMKIYNMVYFQSELSKKLQQHSRYTICVIKPKNFKKINDLYGHEAGDATLNLVGRNLMALLADTAHGHPIRYSGNECALVIPALPFQEATTLSTRVIAALQNLDLSKVDSRINFGLAYQHSYARWPHLKGTPMDVLTHAHTELMKVFVREK